MKTNKSLSSLWTTGSLLLCSVVIACSSCDKKHNPFKEFNPYDQEVGKRLAAYNAGVVLTNTSTKIVNPSMYIDFSSGINKAFADPVIKGMMTDCFNTVLAEKFDVYKLGSHKITSLNVSNTTELGQQVNDPTQYADIWAPIQAAVEKIVGSNNDALLITDFEEWQESNEVTNTAFLKIPFFKWLSKGNSIHFFIANYKEGAVNKHLYFTVFSTGDANEASILSKLATKLGPLTTRFDLSTKAYKLRSDYPGEKMGGIFYDAAAKSDHAKNVLDLKDSYVNGLKSGRPFEFYPLGVDWKTINQLHNDYAAQHQFNEFFRKLYIDLTDVDSYNYGDFDVRVSDITADFEYYSKCEEAKNHRPKLTKGSNGEDKIAPGQADPIATSCYETNGKLKEEWIYKPITSKSLDDVFTLNNTLFTNTKATDPKNIELGVAFDPKFKLKNISDPTGLIRVDVVLKTATPNLAGEKLSNFQWINAKGVNNIALSESIKNTLQELKPANKIIYSYYIKTPQ